MANMSLDELRNRQYGNRAAEIDLTAGKISTPIEGTNKPLAETDPDFMPSGRDYHHTKKRTPTLGDLPPKVTAPDADEPAMPKISVKNASFDASTAMEFDINTLEKRPAPKNELKEELFKDLDAAVEREKKSITERVNAITQKQYEEFMDGYDPNDPNRKPIIPDENKKSDEDDFEDEPFDTEDVNGYNPPESDKIIEIANRTHEIDDTIVDDMLIAADKYESIEKDLADEEQDLLEEDYLDTPDFTPAEANAPDMPDIEDIDEDLSKEVGADSAADDFNEFTKAIKSRVTPIKNAIDLSKFTINKKAVSSMQIHQTISDISTADYILPNSNRVISCSALSGPEILRLNPQNSERNRINTLREIYSIIYQHIVSRKPKDLDSWMKATPFADLDHIYFALYKATFSGSPFINYQCEKCGKAFIKDFEFSDLIVYSDDELKEKMDTLLQSGDDSPAERKVVLRQISDNLVVALRNPSIWNVMIENGSLSDKFLQKYAELIDLIAYIDNIYIINVDSQTLDPVDFRPDKDNMAKSAARRIQIIANVLKSISSDNYFDLRYAIGITFPAVNGISYRLPDVKCPAEGCDETVAGRDTSGQELLFMRHQLGAFAVL